MNPSDTQLKQALAKLLPDVVTLFDVPTENTVILVETETGTEYRDTELLHLCWLVEQTLSAQDWWDYDSLLCAKLAKPQTISTTWQARTIALAKVKGVEIV